MKLNYHKSHRGGGQSQALHNVSFFNNLPEPSLWNSQIGRREFLGKIGKASVGTAIVLNGLKLEVMAGGSGIGPWKIKVTPSGDAAGFIATGLVTWRGMQRNGFVSISPSSGEDNYKVTITFYVVGISWQIPYLETQKITVTATIDQEGILKVNYSGQAAQRKLIDDTTIVQVVPPWIQEVALGFIYGVVDIKTVEQLKKFEVTFKACHSFSKASEDKSVTPPTTSYIVPPCVDESSITFTIEAVSQ